MNTYFLMARARIGFLLSFILMSILVWGLCTPYDIYYTRMVSNDWLDYFCSRLIYGGAAGGVDNDE